MMRIAALPQNGATGRAERRSSGGQEPSLAGPGRTTGINALEAYRTLAFALPR